MNAGHSDPGGDVAKKASKQSGGGDTLGGIAESLGTLLGNAEKQWRAWQGPRDSVVKAVTDVRDRAAALLSEMGAAADAVAGKGSKKGKKKDKKKGKDAAKAAKKQAAKADKAEKKAGKKAGKKKGKKAKAGASPEAAASVLP
jgi:hypothetical protein